MYSPDLGCGGNVGPLLALGWGCPPRERRTGYKPVVDRVRVDLGELGMQDVQVAVGQALLFRLKGVDEQAAIREALAGDPASNGHEIRELLRPLDWHALWDAEDDIDWLIHPLMPARSLVALYSPAGIGKSLLMLEIGAGLSCGREILGHRSGKRYRVLYIDFENDPIRDIRDRLQSMGYEPEDLDHLTYLSFPSMAHLDSPQGAAELLAAVEAFGSEVVVIDTISRAVAGEENDNDTWLNFCKYTGLALKQKGVSCIRLDHTGKDLTKGERGGSAKSGDVDAAWKLTELEEGKRYKLTNTKSRFRLPEREITILRRDQPLHHTQKAPRRGMSGRSGSASCSTTSPRAGIRPRQAGQRFVSGFRDKASHTKAMTWQRQSSAGKGDRSYSTHRLKKLT